MDIFRTSEAKRCFLSAGQCLTGISPAPTAETHRWRLLPRARCRVTVRGSVPTRRPAHQPGVARDVAGDAVSCECAPCAMPPEPTGEMQVESLAGSLIVAGEGEPPCAVRVEPRRVLGGRRPPVARILNPRHVAW